MGQVTAITTPENMRMLGVFRRLGFHIEHERDKGVMVCEAPMEESQATV
jgi:RimJ/RimL family protein N-acetyltransferase